MSFIFLSGFMYIPCLLLYPLYSSRRVIFANKNSIFICANPVPPPKLLQLVHSKSSGIIMCFHERSIISQTCGSNPTFLLYFYGNHRMVFDVIFPKFKGGKALYFCLFDLQFTSLHPICSRDGTQL